MSARPRPVRARAVALVLGVVVVLGACSHQQQIPEDYGSTTSKNFTEGCEQALTARDGEGERVAEDAAGDACRCIYDSISGDRDSDTGLDPVPFDEFKEIYTDLSDDPGPLPDVIQQHVDACQTEIALR